MEEMTLCSPEHQEVFRRVWARVMGDQASCLAGAASPEHLEGDLSCRHLADLAQAAQDTPPEHIPDAGSAQPEPGDPCTARLRRQILQAL